MSESLIIGAARTPIGKLQGALAALSGVDLGAIAIKGALVRAEIDPSTVSAVVMGQVLQAGQGQVTARQAAVAAGVPFIVPATTLNKVCLSGLAAIHFADLMIRSGEADVVVAGGMESMTNAPYLLPSARSGYRFGDGELVDSLVRDGLFCAFDQLVMGAATERYRAAAGISRERQDELAYLSQERAVRAGEQGRLAREIVGVEVPSRSGVTTVLEDEGIRPTTTTSGLAALRPAFGHDGTITAGNSSQLSDGAAAVILASPQAARRLGAKPLAAVLGHGTVAGPDPSLLTQPSRAARAALSGSHHDLSEVGRIEINEAFAAVVAASIEDLGVDDALVNPDGGAIALGHPIGMSGARLAVSLATWIASGEGDLGLAALCGGGGQGEALLLGPPGSGRA